MEYSNDFKLILERAKTSSITSKRPYVCMDFLFDALLFNNNSSVSSIFNSIGWDMDSLKILSQMMLSKKKESKKPTKNLNKDCRDLIKKAEELSKKLGQEDCRPEILLLSFFLFQKRSAVIKYIENDGESLDEILKKIYNFIDDRFDDSFNFIDEGGEEDYEESDIQDKKHLDMFAGNRIIDAFADNLNVRARDGEFDNLIDINNKSEDIAVTLCRCQKPNIILVGREGTGKTCNVELLAKKIVNGDVPEPLQDKVIYNVDISSMVAGTEFRGSFEERIKDFIEEVKRYDNIILFFDEIHTLIGAGGTGRKGDLEASNILKPALARGDISCIGATTTQEFELKIKKDQAFSRRFNKIIINEPSKEKIQEILPNLASYYEEFHGVIFNQDFLDSAINYCEEFLPNKTYPDKITDILDHCGAIGKIRGFKTPEHIKKAQEQLLENDSDGNFNPDELGEKLKNIQSMLDEWMENRPIEDFAVSVDDLNSYFKNKRSLFGREIDEKLFLSFFGAEKEVVAREFLRKNEKDQKGKSFLVYGDRQSGKTSILRSVAQFVKKSEVTAIKFTGIDFDANSLCQRVMDADCSVVLIDDVKYLNSGNLVILANILKDKILERKTGEIIDFSNVDFVLSCGLKTNEIGFSSKSGGSPDISGEILKSIDYKIEVNLDKKSFDKSKVVC